VNEQETLQQKIALFKRNLATYKSADYDEYNNRADFIDFLFAALGWDMHNSQAVIEQFREVIKEDKLKIDGNKKRPDYSFRIGGQIIFYVEAKKPAIDIKNDKKSAYQLRRYAHTQGLALSILTDFEEIAVYDGRLKPAESDNAATARVFYCTYDELFKPTKLEGYNTNFDFLSNTFSKQAILNGSFSKYADSTKNKKGSMSVDKGFLQLLNTLREKLATQIALKNENIDEFNLNIAVQKIIDRLIFLRVSEERQIESPDALLKISQKSDIYNNLNQHFKEADKKYNSGLFISADWLKNLKVDDKTLQDIITNLYYPKCPYEFAVLPIEILGQAYEQFLGKTIKYIRKTKYGNKVQIETKPEIRKAGGVYYTPKYIVDYIVQNTIKPLLTRGHVPLPKESRHCEADGKTSNTKHLNRRGNLTGLATNHLTPISILDPACGSGSFLIGAFEYLLKHHLNHFLQDDKTKNKALKTGQIYQVAENDYRLSTTYKSQVLLDNIYGVDIDAQAVEVTKLSLLLKVLEDENLEYKNQLFKTQLSHILPNLGNNIKCGNSLIGSDFYQTQNMDLFDKNQMRKINTFDWQDEFPQIFKNGGFDIVIGNPPYVGVRNQDNETRSYLKKQHLYSNSADLYVSFMEKSMDIVKKTGEISFITPNKFFGANYGKKIRNDLQNGDFSITKIWDLKDRKVFKDAAISTIVFCLSKNTKDKKTILINEKGVEKTLNIFDEDGKIQIEQDTKNKKIIDKLNKNLKLTELSDIRTGIMGFEYWKMNDIISTNCSKNSVKLLLNGNFDRYYNSWKAKEVRLYKKKIIKPCIKLDEKYLNSNTIDLFTKKPKIVVRGVAKRLSCIIDYEGSGLLVAVHSITPKTNVNINYLTGLLNSNLLNYFHLKVFYSIRIPEGSLKYPINFLQQLPIPKIDFNNKKEKQQHDDLVRLVEQMLEAQQKYHISKIETDKKFLKQKIDAIDKQIDTLVYKLYNLTDDEIKIIES